MKEYAIIVAGGKGQRMESELPKQFILLLNKPILMHTIDAFYQYSSNIEIILVLPEDQIDYWKNQCNIYEFKVPHIIAKGGKSRFQSVKSGLNHITEIDSLVAIHDGVRPLVQKEIINASFRLAEIHDSAIAAVRLKESIRKTSQKSTVAVDRSEYRLIQTPQTFQFSKLKNAYDIPESNNLTDDSIVAEKSGLKISLFEGSYENIKITTPTDLLLAETLLKNRIKKGESL
jgi:2-C-methyl-D-erythritol 4-phosphate cytidylyltransferase